MSKRKIANYSRCRKCRELVRDPDNCENCARRAGPLSATIFDREVQPLDYIPGGVARRPTSTDWEE